MSVAQLDMHGSSPPPAALATQLHLLTGMMGLSMWRIDLATLRISSNAEGFRLAGCDPPPDLELGHPVDVVRSRIHPDDLPAIEQATAAARQPGVGSVDAEARYLQPDGSYRTLWTRRVAERDPSGTVVGLVGVSIDITERVRAREQADLLHRERAAAQAANRAKSLFLARMSHELRTPLNAVIGFTQLMLEDREHPADTRQHQRLRHIHDAGMHLLGLVTDTLDLASIEAGTLPVADEVVNLGFAVAQALRWVEPAAAKAGVAIGRGALHGALRGDTRRVVQVLVNLLSNGIKYNRPGGRVELEQLDDPLRGRVGLQVSDDGRGMSGAQLAHLYEPFERLGADAHGIDGIGIGLSVVRHLVERMGGEIEVSSTLGQGSRFCVWLRVASAADIVRVTAAPRPQAPVGSGLVAPRPDPDPPQVAPPN